VTVFLDRIGAETPLIERAKTHQTARVPPTLNVRHRQPEHEAGQLAVPGRRHHHVPVVGHQAVSQEGDRFALNRLGQHPLECLVVRIAAEEIHPADGPVEDVIDIAGNGLSCPSWHVTTIPPRRWK
jgi:hypothetical protein